jgi:hypothetical protein
MQMQTVLAQMHTVVAHWKALSRLFLGTSWSAAAAAAAAAAAEGGAEGGL